MVDPRKQKKMKLLYAVIMLFVNILFRQKKAS